ncbi:MAG: biopolymer transporter ExbD [Planctomycetota bacterium]
MKIRSKEQDEEKQQLNMTSMIDIVFLLLVFFVMTFKIVELEGDFSIRMPLSGGAGSPDLTDLPIKLRLKADNDGNLESMSLNEVTLGTDYDALRGRILGLIGTTAPSEDSLAEGPEIEIDTDYNLRYEAVINAITAVSGYKDGDQVVKLVEKIKFAKPRR